MKRCINETALYSLGIKERINENSNKSNEVLIEEKIEQT
jgi:hypothetical protein